MPKNRIRVLWLATVAVCHACVLLSMLGLDATTWRLAPKVPPALFIVQTHATADAIRAVADELRRQKRTGPPPERDGDPGDDRDH